MRVMIGCLSVLLAEGVAGAEAPLYPTAGPDPDGFSWLEEITERMPPLTHDRGDRWPIIMWEGVGFEPLSAEIHQAMLARGLVQHIHMDTKMIETARALQEAGAPVIMMQGGGGTWRYSLGGPESEWEHQFEAGYAPGKDRGPRPCPHRYAGFVVKAGEVVEIMRAFKDAGVTVDGAWMDWEGEPYVGSAAGDRYEQASHCIRCRAELPPDVIGDEDNYLDYCWRLSNELNGAYLALPVLQVFPQCAVTNWMCVYTTPERTVQHWTDRYLVPNIPHGFTATNPVAYGNDKFFEAAWRDEFALDRAHVDQFYMHLMLRIVSDDAENRRHYGPLVKSFPWVARFCPDSNDPKIPMMTREAYRESLRHMWLRGVDGMQIFQPRRAGYFEIVKSEVYDVVAVYDEMLEYRDFLDRGELMCTDVPGKQDDGILWSGSRLEDRAVVRVCKQSRGKAKLAIEPWPGTSIKLAATDEGTTYMLERTGDRVTATELSVGR